MDANNDCERTRSTNFHRVCSWPIAIPPGLKHDERECKTGKHPRPARAFRLRSSGRRQSRPRRHPARPAPAGSPLATVPDRRSTYERRTPCRPDARLHTPRLRAGSRLRFRKGARKCSVRRHTEPWSMATSSVSKVRGGGAGHVSLASTARRRCDGRWLWLRGEQNPGGFAQVRVRGHLCFGHLGRGA